MKMANSKEIKVDGLDEIEIENTPIAELETEDVNLMLLAIDVSGSMEQYEDVMREELEKFKRSIIDSKESEKILVARADFSDFLSIGGYKKIDEFDTNFKSYSSTRLYDAIEDGAEKLQEYMKFLRDRGMRVKAVFAVFSDGHDNASKTDFSKAKRIIDELNKAEIVTAFISFGSDALDLSMKLGVKNNLEMGRTESELRKAFNQLSKSLISQSKSVVTKTDDFFEM